jgi:hypothetical protein
MPSNITLRLEMQRAEILEYRNHLNDLGRDVNISMTTKIHFMVQLVDHVMRYVGYNKRYLEDIIAIMRLVENMTFLQANCETQGLPAVDSSGYMHGLPDHWDGNIRNGYIHIVTQYANEEISIDINISMGSVQIFRKTLMEVRRISVEILSVVSTLYSKPYIDMRTTTGECTAMCDLCSKHPEEFMDAVRTICEGAVWVFMRLKSAQHTYEIELHGKNLDIHDTTFAILDNAPVIIFSFIDEDDEDLQDDYLYSRIRSS